MDININNNNIKKHLLHLGIEPKWHFLVDNIMALVKLNGDINNKEDRIILIDNSYNVYLKDKLISSPEDKTISKTSETALKKLLKIETI